MDLVGEAFAITKAKRSGVVKALILGMKKESYTKFPHRDSISFADQKVFA